LKHPNHRLEQYNQYMHLHVCKLAISPGFRKYKFLISADMMGGEMANGCRLASTSIAETTKKSPNNYSLKNLITLYFYA